MIELRVQAVFRKVFDLPNLEIKRDFTAADVEGWDSVGNISLIVELEKEFNIRFSAGEVLGLRNIGQLLDVVEKKVQ